MFLDVLYFFVFSRIGKNSILGLNGPLVEAPEFGDRVRDTDKERYWIPGAFPTIFQNEMGDLHNYVMKEPDMLTWVLTLCDLVVGMRKRT